MTTEQTRQRLNALRNIQLKIHDVESNFYEELYKLEKKFASTYEPLYNQREAIVSGKHEPTEAESTWAYAASPADETASLKPNASGKGLEDFWLTAFKATNVMLDKIQDHDEPILKHLTDVRCKVTYQS